MTTGEKKFPELSLMELATSVMEMRSSQDDLETNIRSSHFDTSLV
jgi:hypothetical protein